MGPFFGLPCIPHKRREMSIVHPEMPLSPGRCGPMIPRSYPSPCHKLHLERFSRICSTHRSDKDRQTHRPRYVCNNMPHLYTACMRCGPIIQTEAAIRWIRPAFPRGSKSDWSRPKAMYQRSKKLVHHHYHGSRRLLTSCHGYTMIILKQRSVSAVRPALVEAVSDAAWVLGLQWAARRNFSPGGSTKCEEIAGICEASKFDSNWPFRFD